MSAPDHRLSPEAIRRFFSGFGPLLHVSTGFDVASYHTLLRLSRFDTASAVLDVGAGTGFLADLALCEYLPPSATCTLVDVATPLVARLRRKFAAHAPRVIVEQVELHPPYSFPAGSFDRVACTFVLDMLNRDHATAVAAECHRLLRPGGLACLLVTDYGHTLFSRAVMCVHALAHALDPRLVCVGRPVDLTAAFPPESWQLFAVERVNRWGLCSKVLVLERRDTTPPRDQSWPPPSDGTAPTKT